MIALFAQAGGLYFPIFECVTFLSFFFFQAEDGIRDADVTGVQTCALPISTRETVSVSRKLLFKRLATSINRRSPVSWPSVSLTRLNWSMSINIKATEVLVR